jgi:hypothetical protein
MYSYEYPRPAVTADCAVFSHSALAFDHKEIVERAKEARKKIEELGNNREY